MVLQHYLKSSQHTVIFKRKMDPVLKQPIVSDDIIKFNAQNTLLPKNPKLRLPIIFSNPASLNSFGTSIWRQREKRKKKKKNRQIKKSKNGSSSNSA